MHYYCGEQFEKNGGNKLDIESKINKTTNMLNLKVFLIIIFKFQLDKY
jgi:hypothetical protein